MLQGMRLIVREEGITGLWKGNLSAEYLYLTYGAAQFYAYYKVEDFICDLDSQNHLPPTFRALLSGALAGSFATALTYPFDLLRTRFAVQGEERMYSGILQAFQSIYTEEGVPGFYRGVVPSVVQIMPYMGLMFGSFDALKRGIGWLKVHHCLPSTSVTFEDMFCGALAGVFSKAGIFPMDVVRKRLQVQGPRRTAYVIRDLPQYSASMFMCMREIVRHEGFLALYKGLVPGIVKAAPASAVTFLVYGKTRELLEWWKSW
ncbi:mitochondrial carrier domain-containing protein [Endogone sp. FLAS-F59071]|nr:mitochondrial carrier domain-containing protein [Endogone sp. FLAS-F59071]|eukprot:RUS12706.1 mitochondrial carrier domain-containing protein [Endogone sp. FLAS-F59071]